MMIGRVFASVMLALCVSGVRVCACVCCVCVCVRLYISYTCTCISCMNELQGTTVRDEKKRVVFHIDIGRRSTIRKLEYFYFCLALLLYSDLFSSHLFSFFPTSSPLLRLCPIRVLSSRNILTRRKVESPGSRFSPVSLLSLRRVPIARTHTNREPLTISKSLRFIVTSISLIFHARSPSPSFPHSLRSFLSISSFLSHSPFLAPF